MASICSKTMVFGFLATTAIGGALFKVNKKIAIGIAAAGAVCSVLSLVYNLCSKKPVKSDSPIAIQEQDERKEMLTHDRSTSEDEDILYTDDDIGGVGSPPPPPEQKAAISYGDKISQLIFRGSHKTQVRNNSSLHPDIDYGDL